MKKLLHERLREIDDEEGNRCDLCMMMHDGACPPYMCDEASIRGASNLADEIERCYIPRPRFEDGEPIAKGCAIDSGIVDEIHVSESGYYVLYDGEGNELEVGYKGEPVKRPKDDDVE